MKCILFFTLLNLGLCVSHNEVSQTIRAASAATKPQKGVVDTLICQLCQDVMEQMKESLQKPSLQKDIQTGLETGLCVLLPKPDGDKCIEKVKIYGPMFFKLVSSSVDATTLCQELTMCAVPIPPTKSLIAASLHSAVSSAIRKHVPKASGNLDCDMCEMFIGRSLSKMTSNKTKEELTEVFDKVCYALPSAIKQECRLVLTDFGSSIMQMALKEFIHPRKICTNLHVCSTESDGLPSQVLRADLGNKDVKGMKAPPPFNL